jgi:hypothetical protein
MYLNVYVYVHVCVRVGCMGAHICMYQTNKNLEKQSNHATLFFDWQTSEKKTKMALLF